MVFDFVKGKVSYIVATENADDLAAAVKLDEEPLVEVLVGKWSVSFNCIILNKQ